MSAGPCLQVIALISGGKDSFFSLLHCIANNHQVIALANLYPPPPPPPTHRGSPTEPRPEDYSQDLNSYMYQTVGHTLIPLYAQALGLPLYRQPIRGSAVNSEKDYSSPTAADSEPLGALDETEDLLPLLRHVLAKHPTATALSTGAILSTYQRTRIESIAIRLNLIPLSYLWQYPFLPTPQPSPSGLLQDMAAVGLDARIIKVASGGLDESFLWENVCEQGVRRRLERAVGRFGGSVLGEGGEYETLVLGGPRGVWRGRVVVEEGERRVRRGGGGEAWVEFRGEGRVEMLEGEGGEGWKERLKMPGLWDKRFEELLREVDAVSLDNVGSGDIDGDVRGLRIDDGVSLDSHSWSMSRSVVLTKSTLFISNLTSPAIGHGIEDQMDRICKDLACALSENARSAGDIVFTTLLLRRMTDFSEVNSIYGSLFTQPIPPARVTVGCGIALPTGTDVSLSVVVDMRCREDRKGLHIQSRSYWAPANIGPYSQAISVKEDEVKKGSLVYIAGQIPLVPASMEVLDVETKEKDTISVFHRRAVLSLQHLWRIGTKMDVCWWAGAIAFVVGEGNAKEKARIAWHCWQQIHQRPKIEEPWDEEIDTGPDAWDMRYGGLGSFNTEPETKHVLPDHGCLAIEEAGRSYVPGFFAVQMSELPRECDVEWQGLGLANSRVIAKTRSIHDMHFQDCDMVNSGARVSYIEVPLSSSQQTSREQCNRTINNLQAESSSADRRSHITVYTPEPVAYGATTAQIVPCKKIWGTNGREIAAGIVLHCDRLERANQALHA